MYSRQLWVNGARANRTMAASPLPGEWTFGNTSLTETVYETDNMAILGWRNPGDIEFVFRARGAFTEQRCTWASVTEAAAGPGRSKVQVRVREPCMLNVKLSTGGGAGSASAQQQGQDPQTLPSLAAPLLSKSMDVVRVENIYDADARATIGLAASPPGTFYFDRAAHQILYKARPEENMASADVVLPVLEQLLVGHGQTAARPLRDITLAGLGFSYTTWLGPNSRDGYVPQQAAVRLVGSTTGVLHGTGAHTEHVSPRGDLAAVTGMPCQNLNCEPTPGAVSFHTAVGVVVEQCTFSRLGSSALYLGDGARNATIDGNEFFDVSASAIAVGRVDSWDVTDPMEQEAFNDISNNYIHDVAVEYAGAAGIWQGFWRDSRIINNTLLRLGYSGVHVGWGWRLAQGFSGNNEIAYNRIRRHMMRLDDGGGLYTSGPQPGTRIHHNYVSGRVNTGCGGCLYRDDGSAYIEDSDNVCDMPAALGHCCRWFISGGSPPPSSPFCSTHNLTVRNTFTNSRLGIMNNTWDTTIDGTVDCSEGWTPAAVTVMQRTGYSDKQRTRRGWPRFVVPFDG